MWPMNRHPIGANINNTNRVALLVAEPSDGTSPLGKIHLFGIHHFTFRNVLESKFVESTNTFGIHYLINSVGGNILETQCFMYLLRPDIDQ